MSMFGMENGQIDWIAIIIFGFLFFVAVEAFRFLFNETEEKQPKRLDDDEETVYAED